MKILIILIIFIILIIIVSKLLVLLKSKQNNDISEKRNFTLGKYEQTVLIEGKNKKLPILILIHGGPGVAFSFSIGCRGVFPELSSQFNLVFWDQLGCGKNHIKLTPDFSIEDYVVMLNDLVDSLSDLYPNNEIYLFGMSWGTILTANMTNDFNHKISGIIAYGQFLDNVSNTKVIYDALIQLELEEKDKILLEDAIKSNNLESKSQLDDLVDKYTNGNMYKGKDTNNSILYSSLLLKTLISPDYSIKNWIQSQTGYLNIKKNTNILEEMMNINLIEKLASIEIPYHIVQGKYDLMTATKTVKEFIDSANNPNITYLELDKSGHVPSGRDFKYLLDHMVEIIEVRHEKSELNF